MERGMSLPQPGYVKVGLTDYIDASGVLVHPPPIPSERWTCLLHVLGPSAVLSEDDEGQTPLVGATVLLAILDAMGRPTRKEENVDLLLTVPIPEDVCVGTILTGLLGTDRFSVQAQASLLLGELGHLPAVDRLIANLHEAHEVGRRAAAEALGRLRAESALGTLVASPWDDDDSVNVARIEAMVRIDEWGTVSELLGQGPGAGVRAGGDEEHDAHSVVELMATACNSDEPGPLLPLLDAEDEGIRRTVARLLANRPRWAPLILGAVKGRLQVEDEPAVLLQLARAASNSGKEALPVLIPLLGEEGWHTRLAGCVGLGLLGEAGRSAAPALTSRLTDEAEMVCLEAALALSLIGATDPVAEDLLADGWSTRMGRLHRAAAGPQDADWAHQARMLLGQVEPTIQLLDTLLSGASNRVRGVAAMLVSLTGHPVLPSLFDAMARDDSREVPLDVRRSCAAAMLLMGTPPGRLGLVHRLLLCHAAEQPGRTGGSIDGLQERVGTVATLLAKDGDWPVRLAAAGLLQRVVPDGGAFKDLVWWSAQHDPDSDVRDIATEMIGDDWRSQGVGDHLAAVAVAPKGSSADAVRVQGLTALADVDAGLGHLVARRFARDSNRTVARVASRVLVQTSDEGQTPTVVDRALRLLDDPSWTKREAACDLLGAASVEHLGEVMVHKMTQALLKRVSDDDADVSAAARKALQCLGHSVD